MRRLPYAMRTVFSRRAPATVVRATRDIHDVKRLVRTCAGDRRASDGARPQGGGDRRYRLAPAPHVRRISSACRRSSGARTTALIALPRFSGACSPATAARPPVTLVSMLVIRRTPYPMIPHGERSVRTWPGALRACNASSRAAGLRLRPTPCPAIVSRTAQFAFNLLGDVQQRRVGP